jgi:hypothetical protein
MLVALDTQDGESRLRLFYFQTRKPLEPPAEFALPKGIMAHCVALTKDMRTIDAGAGDGTIHFWDLSASLKATGFKVPDEPNPVMLPSSGERWPAMSYGISEPTMLFDADQAVR